jgi:hypothetical protein
VTSPNRRIAQLHGCFHPLKGAGGLVSGEIGQSDDEFFFVWTLLALGVTALFSVVLSARALWSLPWRRLR